MDGYAFWKAFWKLLEVLNTLHSGSLDFSCFMKNWTACMNAAWKTFRQIRLGSAEKSIQEVLLESLVLLMDGYCYLGTIALDRFILESFFSCL